MDFIRSESEVQRLPTNLPPMILQIFYTLTQGLAKILKDWTCFFQGSTEIIMDEGWNIDIYVRKVNTKIVYHYYMI